MVGIVHGFIRGPSVQRKHRTLGYQVFNDIKMTVIVCPADRTVIMCSNICTFGYQIFHDIKMAVITCCADRIVILCSNIGTL